MLRHLATILLLAVGAQAQTSAPANTNTETQKDAQTSEQKRAISGDDDFPAHKLTGKVGLVRGVLTQIDPIHDQLVVRAFGGADVRIGFDMRTKLFPEKAAAHVTGIPAGSVVSVDTGLQDGKLFARSVRIGSASAVELSGQIVGFDSARSRLTLRDPISPENIFVQVTPTTVITQADKAANLQALLPGALVKVSFSPSDKTAKQIEILAERGASFTFQGRIIAVDLRSRTLSLSNDTDQSLRELAFGSLDSQSLSLLQEGANVSIQAEFDGDRYNVRSVSPVRNP